MTEEDSTKIFEYDWDVVLDYIFEGTEKKQDDANKALLEALIKFRDSVTGTPP